MGEKLRERERRELEREREMEIRRKRRRRTMRGWGFCFFLKRKVAVTLSPTTKIFVLKNELTNKETRV